MDEIARTDPPPERRENKIVMDSTSEIHLHLRLRDDGKHGNGVSGSYLTPICHRNTQIGSQKELPHYDVVLDDGSSYAGDPMYEDPDESAVDTVSAGAGRSRVSAPAPPPPPPPPKRPSASTELEQASNGKAENTDQTKEPRWATHYWIQLNAWVNRHRTFIKWTVRAIGHALVLAYFGLAVLHWKRDESAGSWAGLSFCDGFGLLLVVLGLTYAGLLYGYFLGAIFRPCFRGTFRAARLALKPFISRRIVRWSISAVVLGVCLSILIIDIGSDRQRLISLLGLAVFLIFGFAISKHPSQVRWRPVLTGLVLQFVMGVLTIRLGGGRQALGCLAEKVAAMLRCANAGASFVFGKLLVEEEGAFAFQVLPVLFFFSSLIQVLYYLGVMQWLVSRLGGALQAVMGTTVCESVNAAGSVFLGMTESPLLIRPYIEDLTHSELHAVMGTGFATASGSVLAAYISYGAEPSHLLTASIMSATGALAFAKLLLPETETSKTTAEEIGGRTKVQSTDTSVIDAAANGASAAINIVLNIVANLVAFVSLLHLLNAVFSWLGGLVGANHISFEYVLGKIFIPIVWLMGIEAKDCNDVATLIGLKTVVNEFVAFQRMGDMIKAGTLSPRSLAVATFALCGFANLSSLAILMSVLAAIAPRARHRVTEVATRSLLCGVVTCFITASIGGILMTADSFPEYMNGTNFTTWSSNSTT